MLCYTDWHWQLDGFSFFNIWQSQPHMQKMIILGKMNSTAKFNFSILAKPKLFKMNLWFPKRKKILQPFILYQVRMSQFASIQPGPFLHFCTCESFTTSTGNYPFRMARENCNSLQYIEYLSRLFSQAQEQSPHFQCSSGCDPSLLSPQRSRAKLKSDYEHALFFLPQLCCSS